MARRTVAPAPLTQHQIRLIVNLVIVLLMISVVFSGINMVSTLYNTMVKSKVGVEQALSNLESEYQRRYALVDNLVTLVKETRSFEQYQIDIERDIYQKVAEAKASATKMTVEAPQAASQRMTKEAQLNNFLLTTLDKLLLLAPHYPTITDPVLKDRVATFEALKELKDSLVRMEDRIQDSRQQLNEHVRVYNQNIQIFPANMFAASWSFQPMTGFEVLDSNARDDVKITF